MNIEELRKKVDEVSVIYASKFNINRTEEWAVMKLIEEVGELTRAHLKSTGQARVSPAEADVLRNNFENELADVLGQVLVLSKIANVDLSEAIERKWLKWHPDRIE